MPVFLSLLLLLFTLLLLMVDCASLSLELPVDTRDVDVASCCNDIGRAVASKRVSPHPVSKFMFEGKRKEEEIMR